MKKQIELELQIAYEWALEGNVERAQFHTNLASQYLNELANIVHQQILEKLEEERALSGNEMRYWQHDETGRVVGTTEKPTDGEWTEITKTQYRMSVEGRK